MGGDDACDLYVWTLDTALAYWFYLFSTLMPVIYTYGR
jgi:hypothetical protein